jgi:hypothetical protein
MWLNIAVATLLDGITSKRVARPEALLKSLVSTKLPGLGEAAAYVAHHAGEPVSAVATLETLNSAVFELRMRHTSAREVERRLAAGHATKAGLAERAQKSTAPWGEAWAGEGPEKALLQSLASPQSDDPLEQFYFTAHMSHAVLAARATGRVIVYVVPGFRNQAGVAIRVNPDDEGNGLTSSVLLPELQTPVLESRLDALRTAFSEDVPDVQETLDWTGATVWEPVLTAWPDLLSRPVAVIPVTHAALLPLYTATDRGEPACTRLNLTLAPSARSLHFATLKVPVQAPPPDVLAAADPWFGPDRLRGTVREVEAIAGIHKCGPVIVDRQTGAPEPGTDFFADNLRKATIAHLACHGKLDDNGPALLLGGILPLDRLLGGDDNMLPGRPLIVLSACEVGGFSADVPPGEQYGFPAGLLAIGARSVVGPLWPVPDSRLTARLMADFHQRLASAPSYAALPQAIAGARARGLPPLVWGSLTHFGV